MEYIQHTHTHIQNVNYIYDKYFRYNKSYINHIQYIQSYTYM